MAHLRMAYLQLRAHPFHEAVRRMRGGIQRLNRVHGVEATQPGGYHETLTLTWARLVERALLGTDDVADFDAFIARNPELLRRDRALDHYSRQRIGSARARREFVLPDRSPLPSGDRSASVRNRSGRRKDLAAALADPASRHSTGPSRRTRP